MMLSLPCWIRSKESSFQCRRWWVPSLGWEDPLEKEVLGQRSLEGCSPCMCAYLLQPCQTLCDPMDHGPLGSSVHGILQARILVWVAMLSSEESSWPGDQTHVSRVSCIAGEFFTTESPGKPPATVHGVKKESDMIYWVNNNNNKWC